MQALKTLLSSPRSALALVLGLIAAVSVLKFGNGFIYDDVLVIQQGTRIHDLGNLPGFFLHHAMWGSALEEAGSQNIDLSHLDTWRPITMSTFVLDAQLSGRAPWAYHLTNLLAHLGVVALVFGLCRRLLAPEHRVWAAPAALFFGLHPMLAEAHIWINGRSDLFAALFGVAAMLAMLRAREASGAGGKAGWHAASALLFLLGCMSKEVVLMSAPLYPLAALLLPRPRWSWAAWKEALACSAGPAVAGVAYLGARLAIIDGLKAFGRPGQGEEALARVPLLVLDSLGNLLVPREVYFRYTHEEFTWASPWVLGGCGVALAAALGLAFWGRRQAPALLWGLVGFTITLAPAGIITATLGWWGFNRYLYVPAALLLPGLAQVAGLAAGWVASRQRVLLSRAALAGLIGYGIFELALYAMTIRDFKDEYHFYGAIVAYAPEMSHGHHGLGTLLLAPGTYDRSAEHLRIAYRLSPYDARIRNNLLLALIQLNAQQEARPIAEESAAWWPNNVLFQNLLAMTWTDENPQQSAVILMDCLRRDPTNSYVLENIDFVLNRHKRHLDFQQAFAYLVDDPVFKEQAVIVRPRLEEARAKSKAQPASAGAP